MLILASSASSDDYSRDVTTKGAVEKKDVIPTTGNNNYTLDKAIH